MMSFGKAFQETAQPKGVEQHPREEQFASGPRRPESRKGILAMALAAAAFACAGKAAAQEQRNDAVREQVVRTNLTAPAGTPEVSPAEALRMSVRVTTLTERMQDTDAATVELIARTMAAEHGGSQHNAYSVDLRRLNGARQIGNTYARGEASRVPLRTTEADLRMRDTASPEVTSLQDADRAFTSALTQAPGVEGPRRAFMLPETMAGLLDHGQLSVDQTQAALRSGLFAAPLGTYRAMAAEQPTARVDLRSSFNADELRVMASYIDHLRTVNYWAEEPEEGMQRNKDSDEPPASLTGRAILEGQIPLSYAFRLYASAEAVGRFSRWDQMTWAGDSEELRSRSAQVNADLCLKLARAMAEFTLRQATPEQRAEGSHQVASEGSGPVQEALPPVHHHGRHGDHEHRPHHSEGHHERHGRSAHDRRHHRVDG